MSDLSALSPEDATFRELEKGNFKWWNQILSDSEISVQIHKNNTISAYYNGGTVFAELKYDKDRFSAKLTTEFVPVKKETGTVGITLDAGSVQYKLETKPELIDIDNFGESFLDAIKKRIGKDKKFHYDSEKAYQFNLARNPFHAIIDAEFKYEDSGKPKKHDLRIDLVRIDKSVNKLVFIEVKTQDDALDPQSIADQLERYNNFIKDFKDELVDYYKKVLEIKTNLGIIKDKSLSLDGYTVEEKPLLLFLDCDEESRETYKEKLNPLIENIACGVFYFNNGGTGNTSLDLIVSKGDKARRCLFGEYAK
jgi:hypothetical protein